MLPVIGGKDVVVWEEKPQKSETGFSGSMELKGYCHTTSLRKQGKGFVISSTRTSPLALHCSTLKHSPTFLGNQFMTTGICCYSMSFLPHYLSFRLGSSNMMFLLRSSYSQVRKHSKVHYWRTPTFPLKKIIIKMAAANGVRCVWVGQNGLLSTPAVSAVIRARVGEILV